MKELKSEGFTHHKYLVKFVSPNNIPMANIFNIVPAQGFGYNIVLFYWIEE